MTQKYTYDALEKENRELKKTIRDLSAIQHTRQEIIKNRKMLKAVAEGISDPMIVLDSDLKVKLINNAAVKYYGISPGAVVDDIFCYQALRKEAKPCRGCRVQDAVKKQRYVCFERDGFMDPKRRELVTICPAIDPDSKDHYVSVRINDITGFQKIETELIHADKMISLGVLLPGMAHEINNPNNTILLNAQLLSKSWASIFPVLEKYFRENGEFSVGGLPYSEMRDELPGIFKGMENSSKRIRQIIRDLKKFAGKNNQFKKETVNINQAIENSVRLTDKLIRDKTDHFHMDLDETVPKIKGSLQGIEQVLINLIENACHAIEQPTQSLRIRSILTQDKKNIAIEVKDQGRGIPENIIHRIMEPFFTTKRGDGGIGLGLSTSLTIIKNHGGTIKIDSRKGQGASFRVILPIHSKNQSFKILIVDDDPASRKTTASILQRSGDFRLSQAATGAEALLLMGQAPPDLLILDVHMPDIDGSDLCRIIKDRQELSNMEVLVITGMINSEITEKIMFLGYENILEKPLGRKELMQAVHALFGNHL